MGVFHNLGQAGSAAAKQQPQRPPRVLVAEAWQILASRRPTSQS
jgi:hypothetical protein